MEAFRTVSVLLDVIVSIVLLWLACDANDKEEYEAARHYMLVAIYFVLQAILIQ